MIELPFIVKYLPCGKCEIILTDYEIFGLHSKVK